MLALVIELAPLYAKLKPLLNLTGPVDDFASTVIVGLPGGSVHVQAAASRSSLYPLQ